MFSDHIDSFDALVGWLKLALGTLFPAIAVVFALAFGTPTAKHMLFTDILSEEDIQDERVRNADQRGSISAAERELLAQVGPRRSRSTKSFAYAAIGAFELATRVLWLVVAARGSATIALPVIGVFVWAYATIKPLLHPPREPPYSLFALYLFALAEGALDVFLWLVGGRDDSSAALKTLNLLHLAACLVGLILCLDTPLQPALGKFDAANNDGFALNEYATLGQWLAHTWVQPILDRARQGALEESDISQLATDSQSRLLARKFRALWPNQHILKRLFKANLGVLAAYTMSAMLNGALLCLQPVLLQRIIAAIEEASDNNEQNRSETSSSFFTSILEPRYLPVQRDTRSAYLYTLIACTFYLLRAHTNLADQTLQRRFILRARAEAIATITEKALVRIDTSGIVASKSGDGGADLAKIQSLVSIDVGYVDKIPAVLDCIFGKPLNISITAAFLYNILGYSAFVGYFMMVLATPFTAWIARKMSAQVAVMMRQRDIRGRAINEALHTIKFIKFSAWETRWTRRIMLLRRNELKEVFKFHAIQAAFRAASRIVPISVACASLAWYTVVAGKQLTISTAFAAILALGQLTNDMDSATSGFSDYAVLIAAMRRIDEFLTEDEVPAWVSSLKDADASGSTDNAGQPDTRLGAANATFQWYTSSRKASNNAQKQATSSSSIRTPWYKRSPRSWFGTPSMPSIPSALLIEEPHTLVSEETSFQLRDISILFPLGRLSVVTGPTGSGKSSLLAALLGEMDCTSGSVMLPKFDHRMNTVTSLDEAVSFCSQHPWLESKTIKENILFGSPWDQERYDMVLDACALNADLDQFEDGDATEIGERGITLSGGQKARVALARAVYARTQTILLDDILSAVDTHTANTLITRCLFGSICRGRTIVLVTHHFASVASGAAWIVQMTGGRIVQQGSPEELRKAGVLADIARSETPTEADEQVVVAAAELVQGKTEPKVAKKLVEVESKASGSVRLAVYASYLAAVSYLIVALYMVALVLLQAGGLLEKFWAKVWTESYDKPASWRNILGFRSASYSVGPYIGVYVALQLMAVLLGLLANFPLIWGSLRAARILFESMLNSVLRSPTRFYDKTPTGRTLNRFSQDIDKVDKGLQFTMHFLGQMTVTFAFSVGLIIYTVPPFVVPLVLLVWLHVYAARNYITASRDLGRLSSVTLSPVLTHFSEMLNGLTTIRAFSSETKVLGAMYKLLDKHHSAWYHSAICNIWLRNRYDTYGGLAFGATAALTVYFNIAPGLAAIVLVQTQTLILNIYHFVALYVLVESDFNAIERIQELIDLPSEAPRHLPGIPAAWPFLGEGITFDNVVIRYDRELEPVLRGVSFQIKAGETIGIVGRTGSGKSTLAMSLFRFVDPDAGKIIIGGRDITTVGVEDLRSQLTLIPQDAVLYSGTVRDNLDPFNEHTDAECIQALRMVHLPVDSAVSIANFTSGTGEPPPSSQPATPALSIVTLESPVSEGGHNWSAGQRQLIVMARAILRNTGIIVLDESTASVDFETDRKIQTTIREHFRGRILVTIAHRLHTVIDYDRILVLDRGQIVEFDTPETLIATRGGVFRAMCEQSGEFDKLAEAAKAKTLVLA